MIGTNVPLDLPALQEHFLREILPRVHQYARYYLCFQPPWCRDEIVADTECNAWERCLKLACRGRNVAPGAVACYALQDARRNAPPTRRCSSCVFSAWRRGLLQRCARPDGLLDLRQADVPEQVGMRLDLPRWLGTLPARLRLLIAQLARGERGAVLARRFNYDSTSIRRLRWRLWRRGPRLLQAGDPVVDAAHDVPAGGS